MLSISTKKIFIYYIVLFNAINKERGGDTSWQNINTHPAKNLLFQEKWILLVLEGEILVKTER